MADDKVPFGEAAKVTRSDWNKIANDAAKKAKARRIEGNKQIDREGSAKDERAKMYVVVHEYPNAQNAHGRYVAEVVSGMSRLEQIMLGDLKLGAQGSTREQAMRRLHGVYLEFLLKQKIMGPSDARKRARSAVFTEVDAIRVAK